MTGDDAEVDTTTSLEHELAALDAALANDADDVDALIRRGDLLVRLGNVHAFELTAWVFEQPVDPPDEVAEAEGERYVAKNKEHESIFRSAVESYESAVRLDPGRRDAHLALGRALLRLAWYRRPPEQARADWTRGVEAFDSAIALDASDAETWADRGMHLQLAQFDDHEDVEQARLEDALASFVEAIRLDPSSRHAASARASQLSRLGAFHRKRRNFDEAIRLYEESVEAHRQFGGPSVSNALADLAELHAELFAPERALELLDDSLSALDDDFGSGSDPDHQYFGLNRRAELLDRVAAIHVSRLARDAALVAYRGAAEASEQVSIIAETLERGRYAGSGAARAARMWLRVAELTEDMDESRRALERARSAASHPRAGRTWEGRSIAFLRDRIDRALEDRA